MKVEEYSLDSRAAEKESGGRRWNLEVRWSEAVGQYFWVIGVHGSEWSGFERDFEQAVEAACNCRVDYYEVGR